MVLKEVSTSVREFEEKVREIEGRLYLNREKKDLDEEVGKWVRFEQRQGVWYKLELETPKFVGELRQGLGRYVGLKIKESVLGTCISENDFDNLCEIKERISVLLDQYIAMKEAMQQTRTRKRHYREWGEWIRKAWGKIEANEGFS